MAALRCMAVRIELKEGKLMLEADSADN